jgi:hypothetical protein
LDKPFAAAESTEIVAIIASESSATNKTTKKSEVFKRTPIIVKKY